MILDHISNYLTHLCHTPLYQKWLLIFAVTAEQFAKNCIHVDTVFLSYLLSIILHPGSWKKQ